MYRLLSLLFLCWECVAVKDAPGPRVESSYYCANLKPNVDMKIVGAHLNYGKWIENPDGSFQEIGSPVGAIVKANESKKICSSGLEANPTGTTGQIRLQLKAPGSEDNFLKIWWSVTFTGSLTHGSEENQMFSVSNILVAHQQYDWLIQAASPMVPYSEAIHYCFIVHPQSTLRLIAKSALLVQGKWIKGPNNFQPTQSPTNSQTTYNNPLRVCVSGVPAPDPEGYKGQVVMENESNDSTILFDFSHQQNALQDTKETYDKSKYYIKEKWEAHGTRKFTISPVVTAVTK